MADDPRLNSIFANTLKMLHDGVSATAIDEYINLNTKGEIADMTGLKLKLGVIDRDPGKLGTFAMSALNGATFGGLDEAVGLFSDEAGEAVRMATEAGREAHPGIAFAGELAGGVAVPGLGSAGTIKRGGSLVRAAGRGAAVGAVEGGLSGGLNSEGNVVDRIGDIAVGAGLGTVIGGAAGGVGQGVSNVARRGVDSVAEEAATVAQTQAGRQPGGIEKVLEDLSDLQSRQPEAVLADLPGMRQLARATATRSNAARRLADSTLEPRRLNDYDALNKSLTENLSLDAPMSVRNAAEELSERMTLGSRAYEELIENVTEVDSDEIRSLLEIPAIQRAFFQAQAKAKDLGKRALSGSVRRAGRGEPNTVTDIAPDFRTLQAIKGRLDARVSALFKAGDAAGGRELAEVRKMFYDQVLTEVSGFGEAQSTWARLMNQQDALEAGTQFLSAHPDDVVRHLRNFEGEARDSYRLAARASIMDNVLRKGARELDDQTELRLRHLFPSDEAFDKFILDLSERVDMGKTAKRITGAPEEAVNLESLLPSRSGVNLKELAVAGAVNPSLGAARLFGLGSQAVADRSARAQTGRIAEPLMRGLTTGGADAGNILRQAVGQPGGLGRILRRGPSGLIRALTSEQ